MRRGSWLRKLLIPEGKLREAMELYPGKTREEVREVLFRELIRRLWPGGVASILFLVLAVLNGGKTEEAGVIRPSPGKPAISAQVQLALEGGWKRFSVEIGALEYEESHVEELHREAEEYLTKVVPGKNESLLKVTQNLFFPVKHPSTGEKIYWTTDAPWIVTAEGEVLNEELDNPTEVTVTAEISYGSECRYFSRVVTVFPAVYTGEEAILRTVQSELSAMEKTSRTEEKFMLPQTVNGYRVEEIKEDDFGARAFFLLLAVALPLLLYSGYYGGLDTRRKKRKELAESCYTEFVTKLSLLLAAGISVRQAFTRLAEEYEKNYGLCHVLSAELKVTKQELDNGGSETLVYEEFGRRIGVLAYRRMASLLTQNVSRGVQGMRTLLLQEAKEVMAQDRANIRQKGEQAGTKLLFPMMGLLFLVFAILLVPAFQSF